MITFYSDRYQKLELFPAVSQDSTVYLTLSDGMHELRKRARNLDRVVFPLQKYTLYSLSLGGATPELAYLTDCDGLFDTGIRFLLPDGSLRKTQSCFQYHFTPPKGQLYAPCGLCYHRGYYHMFYSFAPFSADMFYLGHAVSRDLQHWHHLPLVLEPLPEMRQARHVAGGILSGSAVMNGNRMRLYFSQSVIRRESGEVVKEYILDAESHDLIHFSEGPSPVATLPSGFGPIFRSPKVTGSHMALGSARDGVGTVLLYRQENGGFSYVRPLVREKNAPYLAMPDLFPVGRTHALLASFPYTETPSPKKVTFSPY